MITVAELGEIVNEFGYVTDETERAANVAFVVDLHSSLKEGGVWGWPAAMRHYKKVGEGWEEVSKSITEQMTGWTEEEREAYREKQNGKKAPNAHFVSGGRVSPK
jgi:hypothetical protein